MSQEENFRNFPKKNYCKMELRNEKGMQKRLYAKYQMNPITSNFVLFSVPEEIAICICHMKKIFKKKKNYCKRELGNEKGTPKKKLNTKLQLNPISSYFVLFSVPEEIAIYVTGRKFSNIFVYFAKWSLGMKRLC